MMASIIARSPVKRAARRPFLAGDLPASSGFATTFGRPPLRCGPAGAKPLYPLAGDPRKGRDRRGLNKKETSL